MTVSHRRPIPHPHHQH